MARVPELFGCILKSKFDGFADVTQYKGPRSFSSKANETDGAIIPRDAQDGNMEFTEFIAARSEALAGTARTLVTQGVLS